MGQFALIAVGMVIGGSVVAGVWGILNSIKNRSLREKSERCEQVITSVEEKWLDAENLVRAYRSGRLGMAAFKDDLEEKIEAINRIYKPSVHQLDIFFVKYTENLIEAYRRMTTAGIEQVRSEPPMFASNRAPLPASVMEEPAVPRAMAEMPVAADVGPAEATLPGSEIGFQSREDERIIAEMNEAAAKDSNLQLESFLEMEPGNSTADAIEPMEGSAEIARAEETKGSADGQTGTCFDPQEVKVFEDIPFPPSENFQEVRQGEPGSELPGPEFEVPSPGNEIGTSEFQEQETVAPSPESPFSFSGRVSSEQEFEQVQPPPSEQRAEMPFMAPPPPPVSQPFTLPSRSRGQKAPAAPAFTKDEVPQPATIYDVEAETIIVDRSSIMGAQRPAPAPAPDHDKKSIGITGEDVSDAFDAFFGPSKK